MSVATAGREIPREEWLQFLDEFSRAHAGWLVTVEERDPERGLRELAREVPLSGISAEVSAGLARGITIIAGPRDGEWTHRIDAPIRLRVNRTPEGADEGIEAESAGGSSTRVRFRSAALPETVDGMLPEI